MPGITQYKCCMHAIISRDLYISYPILEDNFFVFIGFFFRKFNPYVWLVFKRGLKLTAGYDGVHSVHAYNCFDQIKKHHKSIIADRSKIVKVTRN